MTLEQVIKAAQEAVKRKAERSKAEPGESFLAWVEVPADVFKAVVDKARETPETAETLRGWRNHVARFPGLTTTVLAEQFLAVAGKAQPAEA